MVGSCGNQSIKANLYPSSGSTVIFPNPVKSVIGIQTSDEKGFTYEILNFSGEVLFSGNELKQDVSFLEPGVYILKTSRKEKIMFLKD